MGGKTLRQSAEESVYEAIDSISDEMSLENLYYPEVYYLHRGFPFEKLGIPEYERDDFDYIKKESLLKKNRVKNNIYFFIPKIILISNLSSEDVAEEAGHFLHCTHSKIRYGKRNKKELTLLHSLMEMFGFFCSKLIEPDRENNFGTYSDFMTQNKECLKEIEKEKYDPKKFLIYQQGYGLGEKLFDAYISGEVPIKKIRKLFLNPFEKKDETLLNFFCLKENMIHFLNKNY
ncbi:MAG: hypothetical protein AABX88_00415 [Nanoarchaeota archaeon]